MTNVYLPKALALCCAAAALTGSAQTLSDAALGLRIMANRQQGNLSLIHI